LSARGNNARAFMKSPEVFYQVRAHVSSRRTRGKPVRTENLHNNPLPLSPQCLAQNRPPGKERQRCIATARSGERCKSAPLRGKRKCAFHSGNLAKILGARGGRRRARFNTNELRPLEEPKSAADVLRALAQIFVEVHAGQLDTKVGNCLAYLGSAYLSALQVADLDERLKALEARHVLARAGNGRN